MKITWKWIIPYLFMMATFVACSDDDPVTPPSGGEEVTPPEEKPERKPSEYTLDEHKTNITAAIDGLTTDINPDDFEDVVAIIDQYNTLNRYPEYDPGYVPGENPGYNPDMPYSTELKAIYSFATTKNVEDIFRVMTTPSKVGTRSVNEDKNITYTFDKEKMAWIGEYNDSYFTEYHFELEDGKKVVMKGLCGPGSSYLNELVFILDSKELANLKISLLTDNSLHEIYLKGALAICGYNISAELIPDYTKGQSTGTMSLSKGDKKILSMDLVAAYDKTGISMGDGYPLTDIKFSIQLADKFVLDLSGNIKDILERIHNGDFETEETEMKGIADIINQHIKGQLHYVNDEFIVANVTVQAYKTDMQDESGHTWEEWSIEPIITLSDNSKFSLNESTVDALKTMYEQLNEFIGKISD